MWFAVKYLGLPSCCALRQFIAIKLTHIGPHVAPSTTSECHMNRLLTRLWYVRFVSNVQGVLAVTYESVSYTHLRAHETVLDLVCRLLLEKKN